MINYSLVNCDLCKGCVAMVRRKFGLRNETKGGVIVKAVPWKNIFSALLLGRRKAG